MKLLLTALIIFCCTSLYAFEQPSNNSLSDNIEKRNTIPQLFVRTFDYMSMTIGKMGMGMSLPGMKTYKSQMTKYYELESKVNDSNLAKDKKKHILTCAKISAKTKGITGSSGIAYIVTMTIGLGKEIYDKSFLNPKGGRDYTDLDADAVGAEFIYHNSIPDFKNAPHLDITGTMDQKYIARLKVKLEKHKRSYAELITEGNYEKAQKLYEKEILPLEEEINRVLSDSQK